jgi:MerR family glutamine synthetase transcriptional repressor
MNKDKTALYSMSVMESLTGLTRRQIRYYEAKGLISPARTAGGHRLFSVAELDSLLLIKELKNQGYHSLCKLKRAFRARLKASVSLSAQRPENDAAAYFDRQNIMGRGTLVPELERRLVYNDER